MRGLRLGVHYDSRYATGAGWASWMRHIDDGLAADSEPLQVLAEHPVDLSDPDLATIAHRFGISIT